MTDKSRQAQFPAGLFAVIMSAPSSSFVRTCLKSNKIRRKIWSFRYFDVTLHPNSVIVHISYQYIMKKLLTLFITALFAFVADAQNQDIKVTLSTDPASLTMRKARYEYTEFTIDVKMTNNVPIMSLGFDVKLPEGVIIYSGTPSERCSANIAVSTNNYGDAWRVVLAGMNHALISGNEGRICTLTLRAKSDIDLYTEPFLLSDNYGLRFFNVNCSCKMDPDTYYGKNFEPRDFHGSVSVDASNLDLYHLGDVDKSKDVTIVDLEKAAEALAADDEAIKTRKEADVNWDGKFSIGDITALINLLK